MHRRVPQNERLPEHSSLGPFKFQRRDPGFGSLGFRELPSRGNDPSMTQSVYEQKKSKRNGMIFAREMRLGSVNFAGKVFCLPLPLHTFLSTSSTRPSLGSFLTFMSKTLTRDDYVRFAVLSFDRILFKRKTTIRTNCSPLLFSRGATQQSG